MAVPLEPTESTGADYDFQVNGLSMCSNICFSCDYRGALLTRTPLWKISVHNHPKALIANISRLNFILLEVGSIDADPNRNVAL